MAIRAPRRRKRRLPQFKGKLPKPPSTLITIGWNDGLRFRPRQRRPTLVEQCDYDQGYDSAMRLHTLWYRNMEDRGVEPKIPDTRKKCGRTATWV